MARPRKPTAKLKLHGTYKKCRHDSRVDETSLPSDVVKPAGMAPEASAFWDANVPQLFAAGYAKTCDTPALRGMCEWWGIYRQSLARLASPEYADAAPVILNQLQALASSAWKNFSNLAGRFGMTPADRAKLSVDAKSTDSDFEADVSKHA